MPTTHRVKAVQEQLADRKLDALIVARPQNVGWLSGFTGTAGILMITRDAQYLITDFRYVEQATNQAAGYQIVRQDAAGVIINLAALLEQHGCMRVGFEGDFATHDVVSAYTQGFSDELDLVAASGLVEKLRQVKDAEEVAAMKRSAAIADEAYSRILKYIQPGMTERQVALELEFTMKKAGAEGLAFDIIVASGVRSALPHGVASDKIIEVGDLVTMDFGAIYRGYCSDMTRTVMVGEPTEQQRQIYEIVLEAQMRGLAACKPGISGRDLDAVCREYISQHGYGEAFGHSTGHGVGRYIHEGPRLSTRSEDVLQAGHVVTIEPGIYLSGWGGVRIEDMVLVTSNGCERLSQSVKDLIVLE